MEKTRLLILFGGQSAEHEVSCRSAVTVIRAVNPEKYELLLVGITKEGRWVKTDNADQIEKNCWQTGKIAAVLSPDASCRGVWLMDGKKTQFWPVDVAFPVLHGWLGEDGSVQGIFELARIPYVGCGVLSSAIAMDKVFTKRIVEGLGIRQAAYVVLHRRQLSDMDRAIGQVEDKLSYPVFVKPSCSGSSRGVSQAKNRAELRESLMLAAGYDRKLLVEETITGRELECAVLGGEEPRASGVGEILSAAAFYDYDAKYNNPQSRTVADPQLPGDAAAQIRRDAVEIFRAVDGWGMARVDFFLEEATGQVVFNEMNTIPGFTSISMYPFLWESRGLSVENLVERLIRLAFARE